LLLAGLGSLLLIGVATLSLSLHARTKVAGAVGALPPAGPGETDSPAALPGEHCAPAGPGLAAAAGEGAPPEPPAPPQLMWAGPEDDVPSRPEPPAEPLPTGIPFQRMAEKLGSVFASMKEPPVEKAFERYFQEYTENLSTKLQLEGDRADLSTVRLMVFDRRTQSSVDLHAQNQTISRFLEAAGADPALSGDVVAFLDRAARAPEAAPGATAQAEQKDWAIGANRLFVSVSPGYGPGVVEVRRIHPQT